MNKERVFRHNGFFVFAFFFVREFLYERSTRTNFGKNSNDVDTTFSRIALLSRIEIRLWHTTKSQNGLITPSQVQSEPYTEQHTYALELTMNTSISVNDAASECSSSASVDGLKQPKRINNFWDVGSYRK